MSKRYPGGVISKTAANTSLSGAGGLWSVTQAAQKAKIDEWPIGGVSNPIVNSLRFRRSSSSNLTRTLVSPTDGKKFTLSFWFKPCNFTKSDSVSFIALLSTPTHNTDKTFLSFARYNDDNDNFNIVFQQHNGDSASRFSLKTSQSFRDPSAWYHLVINYDSTQATSSNRIKMYVNGSQITAFAGSSYPAENHICGWQTNGKVMTMGYAEFSEYFDGYITESNFIDGQALTPSSFGQTNPITGVWESIKYTGTYGTNGFYLPFRAPSNMGRDESGNNNNWTLSGFNTSVANTTYDIVSDVPTQWTPRASSTDIGGIVRGNYCTWNPLARKQNFNVTNGNLTISKSSNGWDTILGSMGVTSGKHYWEMKCGTSGDYYSMFFGIASSVINYNTDNLQDSSTERAKGFLVFCDDGQSLLDNNGRTSYSSNLVANDVLAIALDMDNKTCQFYKNNTALGSISIASSPLASAIVVPIFIPFYTGATWFFNWGQQPFIYTPPAGYKSLCTTNLPEPTIKQGSQNFNATIYSGDNSNNRVITTGGGSDFVWIKRRDTTTSHILFDAVRGAGKTLYSHLQSGEVDNGGYYVQQFGTTGFTLGIGGDAADNITGGTYVAWSWNAGGTTVTNTSGTISSQVRANPTAGFSVLTYTGNGTTGATVGHGLGVAPSMMIVKKRSETPSVEPWPVYHSALGATKGTYLNATSTPFTLSIYWNDTPPTSNVFTIGSWDGINTSSQPYVAYCWSEVAGYSKFGSYTGNGSTDGAFVFTGFRPRWVLIRRTNNSENWAIIDASRDSFNLSNKFLRPDENTAETSDGSVNMDLLSNGFKLRSTDTKSNASGSTYIYAAFAEHPFKNALAR
jgi:hypothetical protein